MRSRLDPQTVQKILGIYNFLIAAAVLADYSKNSNADSKEYLPDIALHTLNGLISIGALDSIQSKMVATGGEILAKCGNVGRMLQIGYRLLSGTSTIPTALNITDLVNHALTMGLWKAAPKEDKAVVKEENRSGLKATN